jgi:hypothetical protein
MTGCRSAPIGSEQVAVASSFLVPCPSLLIFSLLIFLPSLLLSRVASPGFSLRPGVAGGAQVGPFGREEMRE